MNEHKCPVCGSSECIDLSDSFSLDLACSRCGSKHIIGVVRERSLELAVVDWLCCHCDYKWSDSRVLPKEFMANSVIWSVKR